MDKCKCPKYRNHTIGSENEAFPERWKNEVEYYRYIASADWRKRSEEAKRRAGYRCQLCNRHQSEIQIHTHHRTYVRLGNELPEDLTVLCKDCHALFEGSDVRKITKEKSNFKSGRFFLDDVVKTGMFNLYDNETGEVLWEKRNLTMRAPDSGYAPRKRRRRK